MLKNIIPKVYIPHSCLIDMYKSYIPRGMYKTSHILYVLDMVSWLFYHSKYVYI
jgi:hypothetical protein